MRVGIFFPQYEPSSGGGYAYEQEVLQALIDLSESSHHQFRLYFGRSSARATIKNLPTRENLTSTQLARRWHTPEKGLASRVINKVLRIAQQPSNVDFQRRLDQDHIELLWFATGYHIPVDTPYIATVWDIQHRIQPWFPEVSTHGEWQAREAYFIPFLQRAAFVIAPNEVGQQELTFFYQIPPSRIRCLHHPAPRVGQPPLQASVRSTREKYGLHANYLLYPAQFWPHKNHINLLRALQLVRGHHGLDLDLVLVGSDKGNLNYIRSVVEKFRLGDHVHFLGFIPRDDLLALYAGAFALTYVSHFGPENLPPLEAFAYGCPVIASNVPGASAQFGNAALLVDQSRPEDIAAAVAQLHARPKLRANLIHKGGARSRQYTAAHYVHDVFRIMDEFERIRINWT